MSASVLSAAVAPAAVIYTDGATKPNGAYRGPETLTVNFSAAGGSTALSFDLFGAQSVDDFGNGYDDLFSVALNGVTVFEGYFNLGGGGSDSVITNTLGWAWTAVSGGSWNGGTVAVSGLANLVAGANSFAVTYNPVGPYNGGNQGTGDESWALNNLDVSAVSPVPLPAAAPLLLAAIGSLGFASRRSRKRKSA
ncbi:hypothetical protein [Fuscibacter oryzae]|uniref:VPLPA-CTERM sorting domain-containing protein n=1 Tax=Fuscibacter oryzae TaxID=2803939 RepID=A0A8J7STH5_9RHOB|nr:hypothetical protein [Fuscibacter oryzae]MBL4928550.1 hypothetical protein [Fuscibacter oryzae]